MMVDITGKARVKWHGKWIWCSSSRSRKKEFFNRAYEYLPIQRDEMNTFYLFRKKFHVNHDLIEATLNITVDSRYKLFINGKYVGRGIARCEGNHWYYNLEMLKNKIAKFNGEIRVLTVLDLIDKMIGNPE